MKVAINKKYKYLTLEKHCPEEENFEEWVMQDRFETHSIITIADTIKKENLRYNQFDYDKSTDTFKFNIDKHNTYLKELNKPEEPTETEMLMLAIADLDLQREQDKIETQLAIAELAETILGGVE